MLALGSVWLGMDGTSGGGRAGRPRSGLVLVAGGTLALPESIAEGLGSFRGGGVSLEGTVWWIPAFAGMTGKRAGMPRSTQWRRVIRDDCRG